MRPADTTARSVWRISLLAAFAALCHPAGCSSSRAPVLRLPGIGIPPTPTYSGFVLVDEQSDTHLFYYLTKSSTHDPKAPLVWWFNGGPGASSLAGAFSENGPFILNDAGTLIPNPYSWNTDADLLFVEFGPGIGWSYCSNSTRTDPSLGCLQKSGDCSPCVATDNSVAEQNVRFLEGFMTLFPEYKGRPLVLAGESYAGVYGPTLAVEILRHFPDTRIANLTGMWLTDPCTDNSAQAGWLDVTPEVVYQTGLIDQPTHDALIASHCSSGRTPVGDFIRRLDHSECRRAWRIFDLATAGIGDAQHPAPIPGVPLYIDPLNAIGPAVAGSDLEGFVGSLRSELNANSSKNRVYHMSLGNNGYDGFSSQYSACNNHPAAKESMISLYKWLSQATGNLASATNFKRLILSSGDVDPVVALKGTAAAVRAIGFRPGPSGRLPWFYNCTATDPSTILSKPAAWGRDLHPHGIGVQLAGYVTEFVTGTPLKFEFLTFRNSGHMVPAYAPQRAFHVLRKMLDGEELTPALPAGWVDAPDGSFYARDAHDAHHDGIFAGWVQSAMSSDFV